MRTLFICAAAALTLAACQQNAEDVVETPTADDAAMEAASADASPIGAETTKARAGSGTARAAGEGSADTAATAPMDEGAAASSPVSDATPEGAKDKAEATNLHPRT